MKFKKYLSDVTRERLTDEEMPSQQVGDPGEDGLPPPIEGNPTTLGSKKKCECNEATPPGMEDLALKLKPQFKERYGDEWEQALYATLWKLHNMKKEREENDG